MATGSIKQRGKSWYIVYPYTAEDGTYKRKFERAIALGFPNTKRGAEQALRKRLSEIDAGKRPTPATLTVGEYIQTWHEGRQQRVRSSTFYNESSRIKHYIAPHLGNVPLSRLNRTDIRAWHAALTPLKSSSIGAIHQTLVVALNDAVEDGLIRENVASRVRPPRIDHEPVTVWNTDQIMQFLAACEEDGSVYAQIFRLILMTGLRRGEAIALRWEDVDLRHSRLVVSRTVTVNTRGEIATGPPKTRSSYRAVNLPPSLVRALQAEQERQRFRKNDSELVFTNTRGRMLSGRTLGNVLRAMADDLGLPILTIHQLRHTHATWLMANGIHPKIVSERLGHSRVGMTLDLYSHVSGTMQQDAANTLDTSLDSKHDSNDLFDVADS